MSRPRSIWSLMQEQSSDGQGHDDSPANKESYLEEVDNTSLAPFWNKRREQVGREEDEEEESSEESDEEENNDIEDFSDDAYIALAPGRRHACFDRAAWLRTLVNKPEIRHGEDGYMMLKRQFVTITASKTLKMSCLPIVAKIFRLSFDDYLQHRSVEYNHVQLWFQHLFRPQIVSSHGQVEWHFHPLDYNANIVTMLHSLSLPIVSKKNDMHDFLTPKAMAQYVAHTFLQPEFNCPTTNFEVQCYGFPYLVELEAQSMHAIGSNSLSEAQKTSLAHWLGGGTHRFLMWKSFDARFWSAPIDFNGIGNVEVLAQALRDTWPSQSSWINQNLSNPESFGHMIWYNRTQRILLCCADGSPNTLIHQPISDLLFVPMANYNHDRLLLLRDNMFVRRASSSSGSMSLRRSSSDAQMTINLDDYCANALRYPPAHQPSSSSTPQWDENAEWRAALEQFSTASSSLSFAMPGSCQSIAASGIMNVAICSNDANRFELAPPFCICPQDFDRYIPVPPGGCFAIDPNTILWHSKSCKIVACGHLTFCVQVSIVSPRDGVKTNAICKILDMSSLPDHFAVVGGSSILFSLREALVDSSAAKFRREIWNHAFIAPHKHVAKFLGWSLYGPMMCLLMQQYKITFGIFLAFTECVLTRRAKESPDTFEARFLTTTEKYQVRNRRILSPSKYNSLLIDHSLDLQKMFETLGAFSAHKVAKIMLSKFAQLCEGVAHLHARGLVHRDLKPSNVMLDDEFDVKIIDFECATPISSRVLSLVIGTQRYLPVNFVSDSSDRYYVYDDGSVDVFALIEMMLRAFHPIKSLLPSQFMKRLQKQRQYLSMHVLVSYGLMDDGMKRIVGPSALKQHDPYVISLEYVEERKRLLSEAYTANKLASLIQKCIEKIL